MAAQKASTTSTSEEAKVGDGGNRLTGKIWFMKNSNLAEDSEVRTLRILHHLHLNCLDNLFIWICSEPPTVSIFPCLS